MPATNELLQEGRYRIDHELTLDGQNNAFQAYDTVRDTEVVVKEIAMRLNRVTTISQQETIKVNFANQAKILTELDHDSLLHVHDFFSEIGRQYLVLESVDGDDLGTLLERNKSAFAVSDVVQWADQLLDALNYLHTFQPPIIHRGVQPHNIKLNSAGRIKLLAVGVEDGGDHLVSTTLGDAAPGIVNYSPLEQIWEGLDAASQKVISNSYDERSERMLKEPADARTDIYSLGATLYHLVTGRMPVDPLERSIELLDGNPDPLKAPHKVDPRIPIELSEVLMRALEIKRENRFDSALIMRQVVKTAMVRAKEREADELREQEEAAADIRMAEEMRLAGLKRVSMQKQAEEEAARKAEEERLELARAEEQRLADEERRESERLAELEAARARDEAAAAKAKADEEARELAAEAELIAAKRAEAEAALLELRRMEEEAAAREEELRQREAALAAAEAQKRDAESAAAEKVEAERAAAEKAEADRAAAAIAEAELLELMPTPAEPEQYVADEEIIEPTLADVAAYDERVAEVPVAAAGRAESEEIELGGLFSEKENSGSKSPVMMIAVAAVVIAVLAVGGYFFMSSRQAVTPDPVAVQPATVAPAAAAPALETQSPAAATQSQPETSAAASPEAANTSSAPVRAAAQPATVKPKKADAPAAKPAAEKKKAVTVDDLINDN